jgi:hypothetical protein
MRGAAGGRRGRAQVTEQMLRALGAATCADLLAMRGALGALFSAISADFFVAAALGVGRTHHAELVREGEVRARAGQGAPFARARAPSPLK